MKSKYIFLITSLLAITVIACKVKLNYKMKIGLTRLTKENIYNANIVSDAVFDAQELQVDSLKRRSNKLFLRGVDLYKNKKNPAEAVKTFKQSLLVFPQ